MTPTNVAMIFERPQVYSNDMHIYRTHSPEFHITGTGFPMPSSGFTLSFEFDPPLTLGADYTMIVISRTEVEIALMSKCAWRAAPGPLLVKSVSTPAGVVSMPTVGVHVAEVVADVDMHDGGGSSSGGGGDSDGLSDGGIAGVTIAATVVVTIIAVVVFQFICSRWVSKPWATSVLHLPSVCFFCKSV